MMKFKKHFTLILIVIIAVCFNLQSFCQTQNVNDTILKSTDFSEIAFAKHLIRIKEYEQAIFQLKSIFTTNKYFLYTDSVYYLIAKS